jgi:hypothetical protein
MKPPTAAGAPSALRKAMIFAALALSAALAAAAPAHAFQLITEQEAALPDNPMPVFTQRGSPTRRPKIDIVSPAPEAGLVRSPLEFKMKFQAYGGAKVDVDSVVMTYKKKPAIDLTQRLKPYIAETGIEVPQAEVPPGDHQIRIVVKDKEGRINALDFDFQVAK